MFSKLKMTITAMVAGVAVAMMTVLTSANTGGTGNSVAQSLAGINLVETIIEPILAIIPIAIPVTVAILGLRLAIGMFKKLLKG